MQLRASSRQRRKKGLHTPQASGPPSKSSAYTGHAFSQNSLFRSVGLQVLQKVKLDCAAVGIGYWRNGSSRHVSASNRMACMAALSPLRGHVSDPFSVLKAAGMAVGRITFALKMDLWKACRRGVRQHASCLK